MGGKTKAVPKTIMPIQLTKAAKKLAFTAASL